jgi:hypothetical protein
LKLDKCVVLGLYLILWIFTAWLLYPLIVLDTVNMKNAEEYFYRSAIGIAIVIILFGKTVFDLLFPQLGRTRKSTLNIVFLVLYALAMAGGVIFMVARMVSVYLSNQDFSMPLEF